MLYKFKSKAAGDVIMLQPNGRQILEIIGKSDADQLVKGIILPAEMPAALTALHNAIAADQARRQAQPAAHAPRRQQGMTQPQAPCAPVREAI